MYSLLLLLVIVTLFSAAEACGRRKRRPPPPPPPPPGAPPQPPKPPSVVKVVRQREQVMSRNNCKQVEIEAKSQEALAMEQDSSAAAQFNKEKGNLGDNECLNQENFKYVCEFSVFSEIALTTIYTPTGCGCAFTISVVTPRPVNPNIASVVGTTAAYSTEVTRFAMVIYDVEADKVEEEIPQFSDMALSDDLKKNIENQLSADAGADLTSITAAFTGKVKELPRLPAKLDKNVAANKNYVPAIMFSIKQTYESGAMFKVPCTIEMHTAPNAYMSQCQPFRPENPQSYKKRAALESLDAENVNDKVWFREFYLFPKQSNKCGVSGYKPQSRYITSFYHDVDCTAARGIVSFDREFTSTFKASTAVVGGWEWTREFSERRVVYGVPQVFSSLTATWCLGYSQITWLSVSEFNVNNVVKDLGVCSVLPSADGKAQFDKYKETHKSFATTGAQCKLLGAYTQDTTLMAFQNRDARDFNRRLASTMVTGPRSLFGSTATQAGTMRVEFDTLTFRGVEPGEALAKRNWDDSKHPQPHEIHMVYDPELNSLVHGRHAPLLVHATNQALRKRGQEPMYVDPVANPPHKDNFGLRNALGSTDEKGLDGANAGDHPINPFPESYSAPLTLDPVQSMSEPTVYTGQEVAGTPPKFCNDGEVGCVCRPETALSQCDHPYTCNSLGYCVPQTCPFGAAGCKAHTDGTCDAPLIKGADGMCVYKPSCKEGTLGCVCDAQNACAEGECLDGLCLTPTEGVCTEGNPGCPCKASDGTCNQDASCDRYTGLCLFESCTTGSKGCKCNKKGGACDDGFSCNSEGNCVESPCLVGSAGCKCLANKKCNKKTFKCVELTRDGSENACVAQDLCSGPDTKACEDECGAGNVFSCPKCGYVRPICIDDRIRFCNPKSFLYKTQPCEDASATSAVVSFVAVMIAFVALF